MPNLYPTIPDDFEVTIRIFTEDEGGRKTAPFNGIRWDLNYAEEPPAAGLYMIYPDFLGDDGHSLPVDQALPVDRPIRARMRILIDEMRAQVHRSRIKVGTRFYCCEGSRRVAEGQVTLITGLHIDRVPTPSSVNLSSQASAQVEALIRADRRIDAIKVIREATGVGLTEAKAHMEAMVNEVARSQKAQRL